jgi:Uma2 family endonuclease
MNRSAEFTRWEETPARFSAEEFLKLCDQAPISEWLGKVELVHGIIVHMSPANTAHWNAQRVIHQNLYELVRAKGGGEWIAGIEPTVRLAADTLREPDVALLRQPDLGEPVIDRTALILAIEVADSSLKADLGTKRADYAAAYVPHFWVVDLNGRKVHIMSGPERNDYRFKQPVDFGTAIDVPEIGGRITIG